MASLSTDFRLNKFDDAGRQAFARARVSGLCIIRPDGSVNDDIAAPLDLHFIIWLHFYNKSMPNMHVIAVDKHIAGYYDLDRVRTHWRVVNRRRTPVVPREPIVEAITEYLEFLKDNL